MRQRQNPRAVNVGIMRHIPRDHVQPHIHPRAFDDFIAAAREVRHVIAIETFLGRVDVRLNVIAKDMAHYADIYRARILTLPHIADIEALMLIATIKDAEGLPL